MKINMPRRTRAFLAKWAGVVIGIVLVIPIAFLGGTFLLANSRIDYTLNYVTQAVTFKEIQALGPTKDLPPDYIYHISIIMHNGTPDPADVTITDALISLGKFPYEITGSAGWNGRIPAQSYAVFEGDIIVLREQAQEFQDKLITIKLTGTINVKARYGFIEKQETSLINRNTEGLFPRPTIAAAPTEVPTPTTPTQP